MENKLINTENQKATPNYLKRISTLEKEIKLLKTEIYNLQSKMENILKVLKRR